MYNINPNRRLRRHRPKNAETIRKLDPLQKRSRRNYPVPSPRNGVISVALCDNLCRLDDRMGLWEAKKRSKIVGHIEISICLKRWYRQFVSLFTRSWRNKAHIWSKIITIILTMMCCHSTDDLHLSMQHWIAIDLHRVKDFEKKYRKFDRRIWQNQSWGNEKWRFNARFFRA